MEIGLLFCYSCLWAHLSLWTKAALGGGMLIAAFLGLWLLAAASGAGVIACAASGGRKGYEAMDSFFDWDTMMIDFSKQKQAGNLISPEPEAVENALGLEPPAGDTPDRLLEQGDGDRR